jgi:peroxiredoxin
MKAIRSFLTIFTVLAISYHFSFGFEGLKEGDVMPNPTFTAINKYDLDAMPVEKNLYDYKGDEILLIAFMPSVSNNSSYAKIMTSALDTYFAEGLSFRTNSFYSEPQYKIKVLVVTQDNEEELNSFVRKMDIDYEMVSDRNLNFSSFFGIKGYKSSDSPSYVYIIGKDNRIVYLDDYYKGEGEKLKLVQAQLYKLTGFEAKLSSSDNLTPLIEGDEARDFSFKYIDPLTNNIMDAKLSDYTGKKNVLIAFYPAAYSISCAMEVSSFDKYAAQENMLNSIRNSQLGDKEEIEFLMVSISNFGILNKWGDELALKNIKMVNDDDGSISTAYSSFNAMGYDNRTIFIVNKEGKISYINWNYDVEKDFDQVKERLLVLND